LVPGLGHPFHKPRSIERGGRGPDVYDHELVAVVHGDWGYRSRELSAEPNADG
jgi:hypothetical protein